MFGVIDEDDYIGKEINVNTTFMRGEDGIYTVTLEMVNRRTLDGITWEKKDVALKVLDDDPNKAYIQAATVLHEYLKEFDFNLFNKKEGLTETND